MRKLFILLLIMLVCYALFFGVILLFWELGTQREGSSTYKEKIFPFVILLGTGFSTLYRLIRNLDKGGNEKSIV